MARYGRPLRRSVHEYSRNPTVIVAGTRSGSAAHMRYEYSMYTRAGNGSRS